MDEFPSFSSSVEFFRVSILHFLSFYSGVQFFFIDWPLKVVCTSSIFFPQLMHFAWGRVCFYASYNLKQTATLARLRGISYMTSLPFSVPCDYLLLSISLTTNMCKHYCSLLCCLQNLFRGTYILCCIDRNIIRHGCVYMQSFEKSRIQIRCGHGNKIIYVEIAI